MHWVADVLLEAYGGNASRRLWVPARCLCVGNNVPLPNLNSARENIKLGQAVTQTRAVLSTTRRRWGRRKEAQAGSASRTLAGRAMPAALNSGPVLPVAGVRKVSLRP